MSSTRKFVRGNYSNKEKLAFGEVCIFHHLYFKVLENPPLPPPQLLIFRKFSNPPTIPVPHHLLIFGKFSNLHSIPSLLSTSDQKVWFL